ncbi:MAG: [LysW]-lysine hydrolase [Planctomycetota bacterium]
MSAFDRDDLARVAEDLVRIPSVSGSEAEASLWLVHALADRGFRSHVDGAGNAVGSIGEGDRTIALVGHVDTVPGDLPVHVTDGVLHGRGAVDAKGPLTALAAAARRAVERGAEARFVVVGCVEEEAPSSKGAQHLRDTWEEPPSALVIGEPSGWNGVTLGYKGILSVRARFERDSAHGAHDAESSAEAACAWWESVRGDARAFAPEGAPLFDRVLPRLLGMRSEHDGVTDGTNVDLALRLPEELPPGDALDWLAERCPGAQLRRLGAAPAWRGPRTSPLARALGRSILAAGSKPRFQVKTGTADLNLLAPAWGCPAVAYGPGDAALDHTPEERIALEELERGADVLAEALVALARAPAHAS